MQVTVSIFHKILAAMLLVALVPLSAIWYVDYRTANNYTTTAISSSWPSCPTAR